MSSQGNFNYENVEVKQMGGTKVVRKVSVKNGRGYKSITKYRKGKKMSNVKKPIDHDHVKKIKNGIFVVGLFDDCIDCKNNKTRRRRGK